MLTQFRLGNRGLEILKGVEATSVMTYLDKLAKLPTLGSIKLHYAWLSNAAHPAVGSRLVYLGQPMVHFSNAVSEQRLVRRPTSAGGRGADLDFPVAHSIAETLITVTPIGAQLLWESLRIVDDFGLTTKTYRLTERQYWRKMRHRSSDLACPCGCGDWKRNEHKWGDASPVISF